MQSIQQSLESLEVGEPLAFENMTMHPLLGDVARYDDYLVLDDAIRHGFVKITEVSESGSVPELLLLNGGELPVLLLDGEELLGAKQNRIMNITVLAAAGRDTVIPVSCVEAGRWRHTSSDFKTAERAQFAASRARRAAKVSENIASFCSRHSDQGEVWRDVDEKLASMSSNSRTSAVEAAFEKHAASINDYVKNLQGPENQAGAVFAIGGKVVGMELFDSTATAHALMPKVIRSYAMDAIDPRFQQQQQTTNGIRAEKFVEMVAQTPFSIHQAIGEGHDLRFDRQPGLSGGALQANDRLMHLCAFLLDEEPGGRETRSDPGIRVDEERMASFLRRRSRRRH